MWSRRNEDLDAEIAAHLRMAEQDRLERGETSAQARLGARRELGNELLIKEVTREIWGWSAVLGLGRDLRYAARMLRKNPGFAAVVVVTVALGVGANTAIFSTMRAALAPLRVPAVDRAVMVWTDNPRRNEHEYPSSLPDYRDWKASGVFSQLGAFETGGRNLRAGDRTERVYGINVYGEFFPALAVAPYLGRVFRSGEDAVAVLGNTLWRTKFAADPAVIGSTIVVDGVPRVVIGVLPHGFPWGDKAVFCPLLAPANENERGSLHYSVVGRLRDGLALTAAQKRMDEVSNHLAAQYPDTNTGQSARLQALAEAYSEDATYILVLLSGAVGFVLLIACANMANLALARGTSRAREMTVRAALGAGRWLLARQLLAESLLLSLIGGVLALVPAAGAMKLIASFQIEQLPNTDAMVLDWRVLAFNLALAVCTGILFGLAPAWQVRTVRLHDALKTLGRSVAGGSHQRLRSLLVVSEVALTLVLLVGAGLMVRTFWRVRNTYPGYDARGVMTMKVALSSRQYPDGEKQPTFFARAIQETAALPGVRAAGAIADLPGSTDLHGSGVFFPGRPDPRADDVPIVMRNRVAGDYFRVLGVPLLRGRYFREADRAGGPLVAIVDEWSARHFWPNQDAVGQFFRFGRKEPPYQVVGVVGNVDPGLIGLLLKGQMGAFYVPLGQMPQGQMTIVARTDGDPMQLLAPMREIVRRIDVDEPVFDAMTMEKARADTSQMHELISLLLGGFAALALLLAAIGIYGVMAYNVGQRTREFGIRVSLGAQSTDVLRLVIGRSAILAFTGIVLGLAGAFGLTRLMQDLLYGVRATDPWTFAAVTAVLATVTLGAGYLPARRATRVDPVSALREE